MNFRPHRSEAPEINLIPLIDVLLVIIIFLILTTTYNRFANLAISLPEANVRVEQQQSQTLQLAITVTGDITVDSEHLGNISVAELANYLRPKGQQQTPPILVINADAASTHQRVIDVMQAAQQAGLAQLSFATESNTH